MKSEFDYEKIMEYVIATIFMIVILVLAYSEIFDHPQKCIDRCKYNSTNGLISQEQLPVCIKRCQQ